MSNIKVINLKDLLNGNPEENWQSLLNVINKSTSPVDDRCGVGCSCGSAELDPLDIPKEASQFPEFDEDELILTGTGKDDDRCEFHISVTGPAAINITKEVSEYASTLVETYRRTNDVEARIEIHHTSIA